MARSSKARREQWLASSAPKKQERLQAALQALGVDLGGLTIALVDASVDRDNVERVRATIMVSDADLDAVIGALELGAHRWQCPHCGDIYGPQDEDRPPVCDMCKKAERA